MSEKSERLLKIYSRLKRGPVTIEVIKNWAKTNDIKVSERTFYRDLKDLESSLMMDGERIVVSEGEKNKKTWKIEYNGSQNKLTEFDINSYLLFRNFMPLPVVLSRQQSLDNIESLFYATYSKSRFEDFVTVAENQIVGSHFYEVADMVSYNKVLEDSIWSIQNKREMRIKNIAFDYTSISSEVAFPLTLMPLQLLYHRGVVHLAGFAVVNDNFKLIILGLDQIKKYKLTNKMFQNQKLLDLLKDKLVKRFGITENMDDQIYDIEIEFSKLTGEFVKHQFWHSNQSFSEMKNGNIIMKINCGINRELVGWIFQWMSNAKVIKPKILKDLVCKKYREVTDLYEKDLQLTSNNTFRKVVDK